MQNVDVKEMSFQGLKVELEAVIFNPNKYKISITDYDLDLMVDGKNMGEATIDRKLVLPKNSEKSHTFTVSVSFKDLLSGGLGGGLSMLSQGNMNVGLQGNIKAKAMGVKKSVPIDFSEQISLD